MDTLKAARVLASGGERATPKTDKSRSRTWAFPGAGIRVESLTLQHCDSSERWESHGGWECYRPFSKLLGPATKLCRIWMWGSTMLTFTAFKNFVSSWQISSSFCYFLPLIFERCYSNSACEFHIASCWIPYFVNFIFHVLKYHSSLFTSIAIKHVLWTACLEILCKVVWVILKTMFTLYYRSGDKETSLRLQQYDLWLQMWRVCSQWGFHLLA